VGQSSEQVQVTEKGLSEGERTALREILDLIMPFRVDIGLREGLKYAIRGYQREDAIEKVMNGAEQDPDLTRIKLRLIYGVLQRSYGGPLP